MKSGKSVVKAFLCILLSIVTAIQWTFAIDWNIVLTYPIIPVVPAPINQSTFNLTTLENSTFSGFRQETVRYTGSTISLNVSASHEFSRALNIQKAWILYQSDKTLIDLSEGSWTKNTAWTEPVLQIPAGGSGLIASRNGQWGTNLNPISSGITFNLIISGSTTSSTGRTIPVRQIQAIKYNISRCGDGIIDILDGEDCDKGSKNGTTDSAYIDNAGGTKRCSSECKGSEMTGFLNVFQYELTPELVAGTPPTLTGNNPLPNLRISTGVIISGQRDFVGGICPDGKYEDEDGNCKDKTPICHLSGASNFTGFDQTKHIEGTGLCTFKYECNYGILNTGTTLQAGSLIAVQSQLCIQELNSSIYQPATNISVHGGGNNRYFTRSCPSHKNTAQQDIPVTCTLNNGCTDYSTGSDCSVCLPGYFKDTITNKCVLENAGCKDPTATNYSGTANTGNINLCRWDASCGAISQTSDLSIGSGRATQPYFQTGSTPNKRCSKGFKMSALSRGPYSGKSQGGGVDRRCYGTGLSQTTTGTDCSATLSCSNGFANFPSCDTCPDGTENYNGSCKKTCSAVLQGTGRIFSPYQTGTVYSTGEADNCTTYSSQIICDGSDGNLKIIGGSNSGEILDYSKSFYTCKTVPTCPSGQHFNSEGFCESNYAEGLCLKNILQSNETKQPLLSIMKPGLYTTTYENGGYTNRFQYSGKVISGERVRDAAPLTPYVYDPSLSNYCSYGCNPTIANRDGSQCVLKVLGWYGCSYQAGWSPLDANSINKNNKLFLFDLDIEDQSLSGLITNTYNSFDFGVNEDNFTTLRQSLPPRLFITTNGTTNTLPQRRDNGGMPNDVCEFGCSDGYDWRGPTQGCCASSNTSICMQCIANSDCRGGYKCDQTTNKCVSNVGMSTSRSIFEQLIRYLVSPFITQTNAAEPISIETLNSLIENEDDGNPDNPSRQKIKYEYDSGSNTPLYNPVVEIDVPYTYCVAWDNDTPLSNLQIQGGTGVELSSIKPFSIIGIDGEMSDLDSNGTICPTNNNKTIRAKIQLSGMIYPGAHGEIAIKLLQKYNITQPFEQDACTKMQGNLSGGISVYANPSCKRITKFQEKCLQWISDPNNDSNLFSRTGDLIIQAGEECDTNAAGTSIFPDIFKPLLFSGSEQVTCNNGRLDFVPGATDRSHSCYTRPGACNENALPSLLPGEYAPLQWKLAEINTSTTCTGNTLNTVKAGSTQCNFGVYYRNNTGLVDSFQTNCYRDSTVGVDNLIRTWSGFTQGAVGGRTGFKIPSTWTGGEYKIVLTGISYEYCGEDTSSGYQTITYPSNNEPICQFNMLVLPPVILHQGFRIGINPTKLTGFQTFFTNETIKPINKAYDIFNNTIFNGSINELTNNFKNSSFISRDRISDNAVIVTANPNPKTVESIKISTGNYIIQPNANGQLSGFIPTIITNGTVIFQGNNKSPFDLKGIIYANNVIMNGTDIDIVNDDLTKNRENGVPMKYRGILIASGVQELGKNRKNNIDQRFSYEDNKEKTTRFINGSSQTRQIDLQYVLYSPTKLYRYLSELLINKSK